MVSCFLIACFTKVCRATQSADSWDFLFLTSLTGDPTEVFTEQLQLWIDGEGGILWCLELENESNILFLLVDVLRVFVGGICLWYCAMSKMFILYKCRQMLNLIQTQLVTLYKWDMRCTYHVHNMFKHVYSTLIHTNFPCFKLRKCTVSLPVETELGHRSMWRWRYLQACWKNHAQATKMHSNVRKRWNKHMTAQAASWGKMGVNRDVEDLCIYSFWHVNAQCLVHFRSTKGADANLT